MCHRAILWYLTPPGIMCLISTWFNQIVHIPQCVDLLEVEGYRVQYFAGNDFDTQDISGAGNHVVTLTDLQPGIEYTVQVAPLYETNVVGPYSDSITATTLPPSVQGEC